MTGCAMFSVDLIQGLQVDGSQGRGDGLGAVERMAAEAWTIWGHWMKSKIQFLAFFQAAVAIDTGLIVGGQSRRGFGSPQMAQPALRIVMPLFGMIRGTGRHTRQRPCGYYKDEYSKLQILHDGQSLQEIDQNSRWSRGFSSHYFTNSYINIFVWASL